MSTPAELNAAIVSVGDRVRQLKLDKADQEEISTQVGELKSLKAKLAKLTGEGDGKKGASKKAVKFTLKTPKVRRECL